LATVSFRTESGVTEDASWTVVDSVVLSKTAIRKSCLELARVIFAGSGQAVPPRLQWEARLR
jgi:hypothetical protein